MSEKNSTKLNPIHVVNYMILIAVLGASAYFNYEAYLNPQVKGNNCETLKKANEKLQKEFNEAIVTIQSLNEKSSAEMESTPKEAMQEKIVMKEEITSAEDEMMDPSKNDALVRVKDFAKCYDMGQGVYEVSKKCRKDIISYVNRHPDAKYFEIIGIVDRFEFKLFSLFDKNPELYAGIGTYKKSVDKIRKYTQFGLAKYRASEASWVIKSYTKQKAHTYNANYHLVSKKDYKGVVIRAYK